MGMFWTVGLSGLGELAGPPPLGLGYWSAGGLLAVLFLSLMVESRGSFAEVGAEESTVLIEAISADRSE